MSLIGRNIGPAISRREPRLPKPLLLRAHESRGSVQETQEKEENRPVILLVSARVNTKRATKHDGDHVYKDRDHGKDVGPRSFAYSNCIRHKEPR